MHGDCHINQSSIFWHMMGIMGRLCAFLFSFFCVSAMPWKQTPLIKSQAQKRQGPNPLPHIKKKKTLNALAGVSEAAYRSSSQMKMRNHWTNCTNQSHALTRLMAKNVAQRIKRQHELKLAFVSSTGGASVKSGRTRTHKKKRYCLDYIC